MKTIKLDEAIARVRKEHDTEIGYEQVIKQLALNAVARLS